MQLKRARPGPDVREALRAIELHRRDIGRTHLQKQGLGLLVAGIVEQAAQQKATQPVPLPAPIDRHIQQMRLAGRHGQHRVPHLALVHLQHPAVIADPDAVLEDARSPGVVVGLALDGHYTLDILGQHAAHPGLYLRLGTHGVGLALLSSFLG